MKSIHQKRNCGFTLIEMLVVIAILALLAAILVPSVGRVRRSSQTALALSGIRQCGTYLLAEASENQGHINLFIFGSTSTPGARDLMLIHIVGKHMGIDDIRHPALSQIIRTPAWHTPPFGGLDTRSVWGINYRPNPANGVEWRSAPFPDSPGQNYNVLRTFQVINPGRYPLLADSSDAQGKPVIYMSRDRWNNDRGVFFAMRYERRGPILLLDGSARMIGQDQMKNYDFQAGYVFKPSEAGINPQAVTVN